MASHGIPRVSGNVVDKSEAAKAKEKRQIQDYQQLEKDVNDRIAAKDYGNDTYQLTSNLLRWNPEYYSMWNHRRRIMQSVFAREVETRSEPTADDADTAEAAKAGLNPAQREIMLLITEDLGFLIPLLKKYPKCYWIWNHRSWLLTVATKHLPVASAVELWQGELGLVGKMLALDNRNFHGWGYRRTVVTELERLQDRSMAEDEFTYTTKMIQTNLSNFSAWHSRSQSIPRLLREQNASSEQRSQLLDAEFELITRALYTDPYDQSLWFYHAFLISTLDMSNAQSPPILDPCKPDDCRKYLEQELESVTDMLEGEEECKYIYQALLEIKQNLQRLDRAERKPTAPSSDEIRGWLDQLEAIDPLRQGRWKDLREQVWLDRRGVLSS